jgi:hypothetical protein
VVPIHSEVYRFGRPDRRPEIHRQHPCRRRLATGQSWWFHVNKFYRDPLSDQIPSERGHEVWEPVRSADWDSCHSDLDTLRRRSDDAATKAEDVADAETRLKRCRDDDEKSACESEKRNYESAKDDLESALEDVASKVSSASSSCGFDLGKPQTIDNAKARFCKTLNRQKLYVPPNVLLNECKQALSEGECKLCLGIK